jgi:hypothetical protein
MAVIKIIGSFYTVCPDPWLYAEVAIICENDDIIILCKIRTNGQVLRFSDLREAENNLVMKSGYDLDFITKSSDQSVFSWESDPNLLDLYIGTNDR